MLPLGWTKIDNRCLCRSGLQEKGRKGSRFVSLCHSKTFVDLNNSIGRGKEIRNYSHTLNHFLKALLKLHIFSLKTLFFRSLCLAFADFNN